MTSTYRFSQSTLPDTSDPPYYDNIGYADLSDYFYVWLRSSLRTAFPQLLATITTPKEDELVATPERHGGKEEAESFFLDGMSGAMRAIAMKVALTSPSLFITLSSKPRQIWVVERHPRAG